MQPTASVVRLHGALALQVVGLSLHGDVHQSKGKHLLGERHLVQQPRAKLRLLSALRSAQRQVQEWIIRSLRVVLAVSGKLLHTQIFQLQLRANKQQAWIDDLPLAIVDHDKTALWSAAFGACSHVF